MILLALSAAFVGFVHSLSPGHWLPVVLLTKSRRWPLRRQIIGAIIACSGHILVSILFAVATIWMGSKILASYGESIEKYGSYLLIVFGSVFAVLSLFRHSNCPTHAHHGPDPSQSRGP